MLTWSWLNVLTKKRYDPLLEAYGSLEEALNQLNQQVLKALGCRDETVLSVLNRLSEFDPQAYEKELAKRNLSVLSIEDEAYPSLLQQIADPPIFLYYKGDLDVLDQTCLALVGTRDMTSYGKRVTEMLVPDLVRAGLVTISGLAYGIDTQVAKETLAAGGRTVAVLGHGLGSLHPRSNVKLAEDILEKGGLIVSEFPLDAPPDKYTFPARNRIIAGLSKGTVVLEAGEGSGALITADLALEYGREVFAVPGQIFDPHTAGCHSYIAQGRAKLVSSAADILEDFGVVMSPKSLQSSSYVPQNDAEKAVLKALTTMPQSAGDLQERSGLQTATISSTLTMMELSGAAKNTGNGLWIKN